MRVLLSCFYLSPFCGSEAGLGWRTASELARHCDVTVLCGDVAPSGLTRQALRKMREMGLPAPEFRIEYVKPTALSPILNSLHELPGLWFLYYAAYKQWQRAAFKRAAELNVEHRFDAVHHVNVIGYREPGYLWKLGIPFFWGPIGGAPMIPLDYLHDMSVGGRFRCISRNVANWFQMRFNKCCRRAARHSHKIWTSTPDDYLMVTKLWNCPAESMLETGTDVIRDIYPKTRAPQGLLTLVWSGLFQPIKALPVLLRALAFLSNNEGLPLQNPTWKLNVLGDGEENLRWKTYATRLGIDSNIQWHGMLAKDEALAVVKNSDVLIHTSVKEATSSVVLEALSLGLPVICHDACGMGTAVTPACGRKVPMVDCATSCDGFRQAILEFLENPGLLRDLSLGAIERAKELSWEKKIERILKAYAEVFPMTATGFDRSNGQYKSEEDSESAKPQAP